VVNAGKKFPDVTFQNQAGFGVVFADFVSKLPKPVYGFM